MSLRAWSLALLAALGGGFVAGRWSIPRGKPIPLVVGPSRALPEHDLSPAGQVRTVIVTRVVPGKPAAPPAAVPPELGQQLQTTDTTLAAGVLHDALFGQVDAGRLVLRNVQWLDTPTGPGTLGDTRTTSAPVSLLLPARPRPPAGAPWPSWASRMAAGCMGARSSTGGAPWASRRAPWAM